ncbi:ion channel [Ornithinibacillus sp. 4-3]|uniref:Ion channel n=1 Tax=Ornithinibacillus sp. 4-3 TaxID=3231488 RepID=A0AB39HN80_9BACI
MNILIWIMVILICIVIGKSIIDFFMGDMTKRVVLKESRFSTEIFITLLIVYITMIIGFGLIYFLLSIQATIFMEHDEIKNTTILGLLNHSFYFSGVTLLTVGYGDIVPIGLGRWIAVLQGLIGYLLPTAFVLRLVIASERGKDKDN